MTAKPIYRPYGFKGLMAIIPGATRLARCPIDSLFPFYCASSRDRLKHFTSSLAPSHHVLDNGQGDGGEGRGVVCNSTS